jgi:hypothetical protein
MKLQEYGKIFYDKNITHIRLVCLDLLDNSNSDDKEYLEEFIGHLDLPQRYKLFNFDESERDIELDESDIAVFNDLVIEKKRGWLVYATVPVREDIEFISDDHVKGYRHLIGICQIILAYADTLEQALDIIISKADLPFKKATKE